MAIAISVCHSGATAALTGSQSSKKWQQNSNTNYVSRMEGRCVPIGLSPSFGGFGGGLFNDLDNLVPFESIKSISLAAQFDKALSGIRIVTTNRTNEYGSINPSLPLSTLTFQGAETTSFVQICIDNVGANGVFRVVTYFRLDTTNGRVVEAGLRRTSSDCHFVGFANQQQIFVGLYGLKATLLDNLGFIFFDPAKCGLLS